MMYDLEVAEFRNDETLKEKLSEYLKRWAQVRPHCSIYHITSHPKMGEPAGLVIKYTFFYIDHSTD